jgi:hypothetical protein
MKKIIALIILLFVLIPAGLIAQDQAAAPTEETATPLPPPNPLLKGMNFVRVKSQFNGFLYFKGYRQPKETEIKEFNLAQAETGVKDAGIPITKDDIRAFYSRLGDLLQKGGLRVVYLHPTDKKESTVVPEVTLHVEVTNATEKLHIVLVYLTVSKWMSDWSGTQDLHAPVIIWWQKTLFTAGKDSNTLIQEINTAIDEVTQPLLTEAARANAPGTPKTEETKK